MKRFIALGVYTVLVLGGCYVYRDLSSLTTILCVVIALLGISLIGILNPSVASMMNGRGSYGRSDLNYIKATEEIDPYLRKHHLKDIDFVSLLTYLYLFIPIVLAFILFGK